MSQSPDNWLFVQLHDQISNKENIKGLPFVMGNLPVTDGFPTQMASNVKTFASHGITMT